MENLRTLKTVLTLLSSSWGLSQVSIADTIGIIQVIEHPALDQTRQGIIDTLKEKLPTFPISWESAQGNSAMAIQVTQKYLGQKSSVIVALGTTPAQAAAKICKNTNTPVIYASVTDPQAAKLTGNIAGVSNFIEASEQLQLIRDIVPSVATIGIIYNAGEANSESLLSIMQKAADKMGLKLITVSAEKTAEVANAAKQLCGKVDCIFINNDNTALSAFKSIVHVTDKAKIPVFASDVDLIDQGALAVLGPDQYQIGRQAGEMIIEVLTKNKKTSDFDIQYPKQVELHLNRTKANTLGIKLSQALCLQAKRII